MLIGRYAERAQIHGLLDSARAGRGGALVILGDAGVGKSALLLATLAGAPDFRIVRTVGVEAESEIAFAGVDQVVRPLRPLLAELPQSRAALLDAGLLWDGTPRADRYAVAIAMLDLLAAAAEQRPLLVIVDDAHWLDLPSAEALAFVARRLLAEPIAMLGAARHDAPPGLRAMLQGIPVLELEGLPEDDALSLLATLSPAVAPQVAQALVGATGGNALALEEAVLALGDDELGGLVPLPVPLPTSASLEDGYRRRLDSVSAAARTALLTAAASERDDIAVTRAALESLGVEADALGDGARTGLLQIEEQTVSFRHPLARSAVYNAASPGDRRRVHRALAEAFTAQGEADLRVWHLAASASGPDEEIAVELERSARDALRRGGLGAAASALRRAADLTPDLDRRVERLTDAADMAQQAGRLDEAIELVDQAMRLADDPGERADLLFIRGLTEFGRAPATASEAFLAAADLLTSAEPERASFVLSEAVIACASVGAGDYRRARRLAERAEGLHDPSSIVSRAGLAVSLASCGRVADCADLLQGLPAKDLAAVHGGDPALLTTFSFALVVSERYEEAQTILDRVIADARAEGALAPLPYALAMLGELAQIRGEWLTAGVLFEEATSLALELGSAHYTLLVDVHLCVLAGAQGRTEECRRLAAAVESGSPIGAAWARAGLGLLHLGRGNAAAAATEYEALRRVVAECGGHRPTVTRWLPNLVEAYVRSGRIADAEALLPGVPEWSWRDTLGWGRAMEAWCCGLLADGASFEGHFERALELHAPAGNPFERARTELSYGERLRRARRRADARPHLREALHVFERLGAEPWADRARSELEASGEAVDAAPPNALAELTPHELRVASHVATGAKNKEIAATLFVTPKTIDYHLRSIYRKLHIHSRAELIRIYLAEQQPASG